MPSQCPTLGLGSLDDSPRGKDLLILGGDEHGSHPDQLQLDERDDPGGQEPVDNVDGDPEGLGQHVVSQVNLKQPVDQGRSHAPSSRPKSALS